MGEELTQCCLYLNGVDGSSRGNPGLVCCGYGRGGGIWLLSWVYGSGGWWMRLEEGFDVPDASYSQWLATMPSMYQRCLHLFTEETEGGNRKGAEEEEGRGRRRQRRRRRKEEGKQKRRRRKEEGRQRRRRRKEEGRQKRRRRKEEGRQKRRRRKEGRQKRRKEIVTSIRGGRSMIPPPGSI